MYLCQITNRQFALGCVGNTGDKSIKVRQEHNISIGKTSLTKSNITPYFLMFLTFQRLYTYFVISNNIYIYITSFKVLEIDIRIVP